MKLNLKLINNDNDNSITEYIENLIKNAINNDFSPIYINIDKWEKNL